MKEKSIFDILRKGKPDADRAVVVMAVMGFLLTAAALLIHLIPPGTEFRSTLSDQALAILCAGQAAAGFLLLLSAVGISQGREWGKRTGQVSLLLVFAGLLYLLFRWFIANNDPELAPAGASKFVSEIFSLFLLAPLAMILFFGLSYLQRLPNKRHHGSHRA
jgi:hypothetical protein